jgi:membrane dipeptidase
VIQRTWSRRRFIAAGAAIAGAATASLRRAGRAAETSQPRTVDIVAKTIGIDTHNHIDVPMTPADMPGPDIELAGEMTRSGLSAICMTFATDYRAGNPSNRAHCNGPSARTQSVAKITKRTRHSHRTRHP